MGYWTTDFLVVQRVLAAKDCVPRTRSHHRLVFQDGCPTDRNSSGLIGLAVLPEKLVPESALQPGQHSYNDVLPLMLARYCGPGLMGLGVTALVAGFMAEWPATSAPSPRVDLRHLSSIHPQDRAGCALRFHGPLVHNHRLFISIGTA